MQKSRATLAAALILGTASIGSPLRRVQAQDLPSDDQLQKAFGAAYNHLGLIEYCADRGYANAGDIANARQTVVALLGGMPAAPSARALEGVGQHGTIVGPQVVGLMDSSNPMRPEEVRDGQSMTLAENARLQKSSERALCRQMADQAAVAVEAGSNASSDR
jgi:hypothetical protein